MSHCKAKAIKYSQGSVATCLWCDRIVNVDFITYLLASLTGKKCEHCSAFGEVRGKTMQYAQLKHKQKMRRLLTKKHHQR